MVDYTQFLPENRLNGCQIFGRFDFLTTESEQNFGFPHIPTNGLVAPPARVNVGTGQRVRQRDIVKHNSLRCAVCALRRIKTNTSALYQRRR